MPEPADVRWSRDELVLVLNLYRVHGARPPEGDVSKLSRELRGFGAPSQGDQPAKHRSTSAVVMKLDQFEELATKRATSRGISEGVGDVWAEFGPDLKRNPTRIWTEATQIRERLTGSAGDPA